MNPLTDPTVDRFLDSFARVTGVERSLLDQPGTTAVTTEDSATTEPAARSMPPETTTKVMPSAAMPTMTVCVATVFRL